MLVEFYRNLFRKGVSKTQLVGFFFLIQNRFMIEYCFTDLVVGKKVYKNNNFDD